MTNEQQALADKIMQAHILQGGKFNWLEAFYESDSIASKIIADNLSERDKIERYELIKRRLLEEDLIRLTHSEGDTSELTKKGWKFKSWSDLNKAEARAVRVSNAKDTKALYWWVWMLLGYLLGFLSAWFAANL